MNNWLLSSRCVLLHRSFLKQNPRPDLSHRFTSLRALLLDVYIWKKTNKQQTTLWRGNCINHMHMGTQHTWVLWLAAEQLFSNTEQLVWFLHFFNFMLPLCVLYILTHQQNLWKSLLPKWRKSRRFWNNYSLMNKNACLDPIPDVKDLHLYVVSSPASTAEIRYASLKHSCLQSSKI